MQWRSGGGQNPVQCAPHRHAPPRLPPLDMPRGVVGPRGADNPVDPLHMHLGPPLEA